MATRGAKRFQGMNELELLRWAASYLERHASDLRQNYATSSGRLEPAHKRREVHDLEAFVKRTLELAPPFADPLADAVELLESRLVP